MLLTLLEWGILPIIPIFALFPSPEGSEMLLSLLEWGILSIIPIFFLYFSLQRGWRCTCPHWS